MATTLPAITIRCHGCAKERQLEVECETPQTLRSRLERLEGWWFDKLLRGFCPRCVLNQSLAPDKIKKRAQHYV